MKDLVVAGACGFLFSEAIGVDGPTGASAGIVIMNLIEVIGEFLTRL